MRAPGPNVVVEACGSTNDLARELGLGGHPHGTWVSARRQSEGRGRLGRAWESHEGNLFLSLVFRSSERRHWSWIPLAAAVGVAETLEAIDPRYSARVKWPNDLCFFAGTGLAKLGGILCEAVGTGERAFVIVGIGLNCVSAPKGLSVPAVSLTELRLAGSAAAGAVLADEVRGPLVEGLHRVFAELIARGPAGIRARYERRAIFVAGTEIEWGESAQAGIVKGLGEAGELLVEVPQRAGELVRLFSEEIRAVRRASGGSLP
ncbi:MAG: biotin--[acetyl-CoA-carboxylase] ligase [Oligoflexia bacterium]|nr:biotin--[acetyl-CoA-carboxylase] ligase [Oligoflexia bacterium]